MNSMPPMPANWPEQKIYIGNVNKLGADNLIAEILAATPHSAFHYVLGRIIERLIEENYVLGLEENPTVPRVAWATRNAMELRILSKYVC